MRFKSDFSFNTFLYNHHNDLELNWFARFKSLTLKFTFNTTLFSNFFHLDQPLPSWRSLNENKHPFPQISHNKGGSPSGQIFQPGNFPD